MIEQNTLLKSISENFFQSRSVDSSAKEIGLISHERFEVEQFLMELGDSELNSDKVIEKFGYDFSGFFSFLTGAEIRMLLPDLSRMMISESSKCEDLDLSFLRMLSGNSEFNRERQKSFLLDLSKQQKLALKELVNKLFDPLDETILSLESYSKSDLLELI
ncbi:hypothetical protein [Reinekea blandensis]|uniref:Uncharacterized protein n=1 Tax=Reinekea blandensis MED297 TaxID=314283 RepID=A4B8W9_9GAMM|nr:hypothetical protein [Reinekea blandensis]EAR11070.1 hypothetical protein MED297_19322 [Reinekea sp. MED297] [Reinekea blandensis MED297]